ncbi:MAG TPA: SGNH/GDSL hydrolase family protein [Chloroflexota bacterium]
MLRRVLSIVAVMALGVVSLRPNSADASAPQFNPPKQYYLALGDSLAFGYQQVKVDQQLAQSGTVNPAAFTTGYVDDFAQMLGVIQPYIQTVNYGCPGETSTEFLSSAGCPTYPFSLHNGFATSQRDAALAFLQAHPGQVSPITLDIGTNDIVNVVAQCGGYSASNLPCIYATLPGVLDQIAVNLNQILSELRTASPSSEIIVMQYYNPIAVIPSLTTASNSVVNALNSVIAAAATANRARLADAFQPFNLAPQEPQTLCVLTLMCTAHPDIHASDAGYLVIAQQFWSASDYAQISG